MSTINPESDLSTGPLMSLQVRQEPIEPVAAVEPRQRTVIAAPKRIWERDPSDEESEIPAQQEYPTDSHELAVTHEGPGAAEADQDGVGDKAKDLGWDKEPEEIPSLFSDYTNDELWTLIRRFNQVPLERNDSDR